MTTVEREQVKALRRIGMSYARIANTLGISENTVKAHCQRYGLGGVGKAKEEGDRSDDSGCRQCGSTLIQRKGGKPRKFCSDNCRNAWWNTHREELGTARPLICMSCKAIFLRPEPRKYCSVACYMDYRFRRKANDQTNAGS